MSLRVKQRAEYKGNEQWKWSVWLEGDRGELEDVKTVTYRLHPTFPDPVVIVQDRQKKFRLDASGWGEFEILVEVERRGGAKEQLTHWLELRYPEKEKPRGSRPRSPVVFLTSGAADAEAADVIRKGLERRRIKVLTSADAPVGFPFEASLRSLVGQADASVVLLSDRPSPWLGRELDAMQEEEQTIFPITLGKNVKLPRQLEGRQPLEFEDATKAQSVVDSLVKELRSRRVD